MQINPIIFRNYDIRGIVPENLNPDVAEEIGKAFGTFIQSKFGPNIVVGCDNRKTSPSLKDQFIYGLMQTGCQITDVGMTLTPIIHFLTYDKKFSGGVMITASHNPKEFNGFRFAGKDGVPIFGEDIKDLKKIIEEQSFKQSKGDIFYADKTSEYLENLKHNFNFKRRIKVVIDCGNGTSSILASEIMKELNVQAEALYCDLNSDYPHGIPDPENNVFMEVLSAKVQTGKYDVGFAYDTDADRFGVVDEKGDIHENDKILLLFAKYVLHDHPGAKILFDVKCSETVASGVKKLGGEPIILRTGHPYFLNGMKEGALLGAEFSGHTFFADKYYGFDDGIYASLRIIEILDREGKPLSELLAEFPKTFHTNEIKIPIADDKKQEIVAKIEKFLETSSAVKKSVKIDGIRAYLSDESWFLIRASNTSPYISLRFESTSEDGLNRLFDLVASVLPEFRDLKEMAIHFL